MYTTYCLLVDLRSHFSSQYNINFVPSHFSLPLIVCHQLIQTCQPLVSHSNFRSGDNNLLSMSSLSTNQPKNPLRRRNPHQCGVILQCFVNNCIQLCNFLNPSTFLPHFCILQRERSTCTSRWVPIQGLPSTSRIPPHPAQNLPNRWYTSAWHGKCAVMARGWTILSSNQIWPNFWCSAQNQIDWVATCTRIEARTEFAGFGFLFNQRYTAPHCLIPGADSGTLVPYSDSPIHRSQFSKWWDDEHVQSARLPRPNFARLW